MYLKGMRDTCRCYNGIKGKGKTAQFVWKKQCWDELQMETKLFFSKRVGGNQSHLYRTGANFYASQFLTTYNEWQNSPR